MFGSSLFHIVSVLDTYKHSDLKWYHMIPLMELIILILFNYGDVSVFYMIFYWMIMHGTTTCIAVIVSTPIHRSDYCWTEGDGNGTKDFLEHILLTTQDYYTDFGLSASLFMFDTFNDHRLHHLFPTLDASKIPILKP
eukprot:281437_1